MKVPVPDAKRSRRDRLRYPRVFAGAMLAVAAMSAPATATGEDPVGRDVGRGAPKLTVVPYALRLRDGTVLQAERGSFEVPERRADAAS